MRQNFVDTAVEPEIVTASAASGSAATIEIPADKEQFWAIDWISWSYAAEPTGGNLQVQIGGDVVWQVDIVEAGPGHFEFRLPLYKGIKNQAVSIVLASGGAAKKLNVRYR